MHELVRYDNKTEVGFLVDSLRECNNKRDIDRVRLLHAVTVKHGLDYNSFLASTLVYTYSKCGFMADARRAFDKIKFPDVVLYTSLILGYAENGSHGLALEVFSSMLREGCRPNARTYVAALKACSCMAATEEGKKPEDGLVKVKSLETGMTIHSLADCDVTNIFVANTLVDMYSNCGSVEDARRTFERMPYRSIVSWSAIILGYVDNNLPEAGLTLFSRMQREGLTPNAQTFVALLKACKTLAAGEPESRVGEEFVKVRSLEKGMAIHAEASRFANCLNVFVGNTLVDMYSSCMSMFDAQRVFNTMASHTVVSWNTLIQGYAENGNGKLALQILSEMIYRQTHPNSLTFAGALKACGSDLNSEDVRGVQLEICRLGLESENILAACLVDVFCKSGSLENAQRLCDSMASIDLVTWNTLVAGHSRHGTQLQRVFNLFSDMQDEGICPDGGTLLSILTACSHAGLVERGRETFRGMRRKFGVAPGIEHYVCMIDLLGRANALEEALEMAESLPVEINAAAWRAVLAACEKWRNVDIGRRAYEELMRLDGTDAAAYLLMAGIYRSAGMWEEEAHVETMRIRAGASF